MATQNQIKDLLAQRTVALVGLSRSGQAFSNKVHRALVARGYHVYPVNPNAEAIEGEPCYPSVASLPEAVGAALFFTPPAETEKAVREAIAAGVQHLWLQPGAETAAAIGAGRESQVSLVAGECILMFLTPVAMGHQLHRWVKGILGQLPR